MTGLSLKQKRTRLLATGRFQIFGQVCLPLATNSLAALAIFSFLGLWNDLSWPLIAGITTVSVTFSHWLASRLRGDVKDVFRAGSRAKNILKNHLLLRENFQDGEVKAA